MLLLQIGLQVAFFPEEEEEVPEQPVKFRGTLPENFTWGNNPCIPYNQLDQGSCGSCWATSTTMAIGERRCLKYGKKQILAIEELVACDHTSARGVTNKGCNGGSTYPAMIYTNRTGTTTEECYKYYSLHTYYPYPNLTCQEKCDNGSVKPRIHTESPY